MKISLLLIGFLLLIGNAKAQTVTTKELSYAFGLSQAQGLKGYLTIRMNVDTAYMESFAKGVTEAAKNTKPDTLAYYAGIQIGLQIATSMISGINENLYGEHSTKSINLHDFLEGFLDGALNKETRMSLERAVQIADKSIKSAEELKAKKTDKVNH